MRSLRRILAAALLGSAAAVCTEPSPLPEISCANPNIRPIAAGDSVVVSDSEAPCAVEFREVTRLGGTVEGKDPRVPVGLGPGGTYLTATYDPGEVAVWSANGDFVRTFGNGEGSGPGEFSLANSLVVDSDSVVNILGPRPRWHRYAWSGTFLETVRIPTLSGGRDMVLAEDGALVTSTFITERGVPPLVVWRKGADSVQMIESPRITGDSPQFLDATPGMGVWSLQPDSYLLRRHDAPDFAVDAQVVRVADWFPGPRGDVPPVVFDFAADDRGLIWTLVTLAAPDAPSGPKPEPTSAAESRAIANRYRNTMIEVLTVDGRLLASRTYEDIWRIPRPISAERWYREEADVYQSIVILEPRLVER